MIITGPKLDQAAEVVRRWYLDTRARLIKAMEEGYPYGNVPVTPQLQVERFLSMTQEDLQVLMTRLMERYRGEPNAQELARKDIEDYITKMNRMAFSRRVA